jgi:quinol-cytochrome oxidoreductase complex cytochrome b subunit
MVYWSNHTSFNDYNSLSWVCLTLGTDVISGCNSNNKPGITVPIVGQQVVIWLWSGFSVDNPTLNKFFSLHYILPFIILALVLLHLALLHQSGSTSPAGFNRGHDQIPFHPFFVYKDLVSIIILITIIMFFVSFIPNSLGHPDNYIPAILTRRRAHSPEWYFLPFYAYYVQYLKIIRRNSLIS